MIAGAQGIPKGKSRRSERVAARPACAASQLRCAQGRRCPNADAARSGGRAAAPTDFPPPIPSSHPLAEVELSTRVILTVECPCCPSLRFSLNPSLATCLICGRATRHPRRNAYVWPTRSPAAPGLPRMPSCRCLPWYSELSLPLPTELVACTSRPLVTMHHLCPPSHRDEPVQYELSPAPRGVCRAPGSLAAVSAGLVRAPFGRRLVVLSASGICLWSRLCSHRRTIAVHSPRTSHAPSRAALRRTLLAPLLSAGAAGLPA